MNLEELIILGENYYNKNDYEKAYKYFLQAAEMSDAKSMFYLGTMQSYKDLTRQDLFNWIKKSAELGYTKSFGILASKYMLGDGVEVDKEKAYYWAKKDVEENKECFNSENIIAILNNDSSFNKDISLNEELSDENQLVKTDDNDEINDENSLISEEEIKEEFDEVIDATKEPGWQEYLDAIEYHDQNNIPKAIELYEKALELGCMIASVNLSMIYAENEEVKDLEKSFKILKDAENSGWGAVSVSLAYKYYAGIGTEYNFSEAKRLFLQYLEKEAKYDNYEYQEYAKQILEEINNYPEGQDLLFEGLKNEEIDYEKAAYYYEKACELNNPEAFANLANLYQEGLGVEKNIEKMLELLEKSCELGSPSGLLNLSQKYAYGEYVDVDYKKAKELLDKIDDEEFLDGNAMTIFMLKGKLEELEDDDIPGNHEMRLGNEAFRENRIDEAIEYFKKSADLKNPYGMYQLANAYLSKNNEMQFINWMKKASYAGCKDADIHVAKYDYYNGDFKTDYEYKRIYDLAQKSIANGITDSELNMIAAITKTLKDIPKEEHITFTNAMVNYNINKNYSEALKYLEKAGRKGYPLAFYYIGLCYYYGYGIEQNYSNAFLFMEQGAYRGDIQAIKFLSTKYSGPFVGLWKAYREYENLAIDYFSLFIFTNYCDQLRNESLNSDKEYVANAKEAMIKSANISQLIRNERDINKIAEYNRNNIYYLEKAMGYGNIDAVVEYSDKICKGENVIRCLERAAFMGHPYAMYKMAEYLEKIDYIKSEECYKQAAIWGYGPAITKCRERNISYEN